METLNIDWENIESRFVRDEVYEGIRAPKWFDFLALEEPVDDDAWFCRPDCNHPRTAASLINTPLSQSKRMKNPKLVNSTSPVKTSSPMPLRDRTARTLNCKKTRGPLSTSVNCLDELKAKENASGMNHKKTVNPLSTSVTSLYDLKPKGNASALSRKKTGNLLSNSVNSLHELKAKDNASTVNHKQKGYPRATSINSFHDLNARGNSSKNSNKASPMRRNKRESGNGKYHSDAENDNPNRPPSTIRKSQGMRNAAFSPAKASKQSIGAKESQRPPSTERIRVAKQAFNSVRSSNSRTSSPFKKGLAKQAAVHNVSGRSSRGSSLGKKEAKKQMSSNATSTPATTPTRPRPTRPTSNKTPVNDHRSPSLKPGSALKATFSTSSLFGRSSRRDLFSQFTEMCSAGLKKLALPGGQKDSTKLSNKPFDHCSDSSTEEKGKQTQDINVKSLSDLLHERSSQIGHKDDEVMTSSIIDDPDKCTKAGQIEIGGLRQRNSKKATAKSCSKSGEQKNGTCNAEKKEDDEDFAVLTENIVRDKLANMLANTEDANDTFLDSYYGPIHCLVHENVIHSVGSKIYKFEESSDDQENLLMEPHKSHHSKMLSTGGWKKKRNDGGEPKLHSSRTDNCKMDQRNEKVHSRPPSPQKVSRLSRTSSSSSRGKRSTTPLKPFKERGTAREYRKLQRSNTCGDHMLPSPEPRLNMLDMFGFLKRCT